MIVGDCRSLLCRSLLLVGIVGAGVSTAQERPIVALFDMEDKGAGIKPALLLGLTELLSVYLAEGGYQVIPRDQVRARLREQKKQSQKDCYDQSCQVELGRELAAQKTVSTQIIKIGGTCNLTAMLLDLKRSATEKAASTKAECTEQGLGAAVEEIARKLTGWAPTPGVVNRAQYLSFNDLTSRKASEPELAARVAEEDRKRQAALVAARAEADRKKREEAQLQAELRARLAPPREIEPPRTMPTDESPPANAYEASEHQGYSRNTWGHLTFWTGAGVALLAAPAYILAKDAADSYAANPTKDADSKSRIWMGVLWGSVGVGTLMMGTGIALWYLDWRDPGDKIAITPLIDGRSAACAITGRW